MNALVTGATGFIGSTLIELLSAHGFEVFALMRKTSSSANLEGLKYTRIEGDMRDEESLRRAVATADYVFHVAGVVAGPNRQYYFDHNTKTTASLARIVSEVRPGLTRFVFVSSLAAGGPVNSLRPRDETQPDHPVSAYGESKLEAERELLRFKSVFPITIVRPPMVYGPRDKGVFVVIKSISRNLMPLLAGAGEGGHKYYSAIHAKDLCRGIVQAAEAPAASVPSGEVFYLSGDGIHTYQELLGTIAKKLNRKPLKIRVPKFAVMALAAGGSALGALTKKTFALNLDKVNELLPDYWICSNEKAKAILGFSPEYDLSSGMADAIEWYKRQKWI